MNMKRTLSLFKREIMDILRDKKTLVMMIAIPLLLYPLLIIGMALFMSAIATSQEEKTYLVSFENNIDFVNQIETILDQDKEEIGYTVKVVKSDDCNAALLAEEIDAYVKMDTEGQYKLCYLSAKDKSSTAANAVKSAFVIYRDQLREQKIKEAGLDVDTLLNPIAYELDDLSSTEESVGNLIGSFIPFMIITSILLGAIYPAIDVTAGEKERGTLETLLTLPITNTEMIMSKFLAVSVLACVSALLNVFSMGGAVLFLVSSSLAAATDLNISIHYQSFIPGILFTLIVMMFFALLVTAVCMCVCVFAKSFKEANNYSTPVMLVFMLSSYVTMIPDFNLNIQNAAVPIINVALMIKGLFQFQYDYGLFAIVLFSNVAYSLLAVLVLGKIYNSENILFSDGFTSVRLFHSRSEMNDKQMPGFGDVVLVLCVSLLAMFYLGSFAQVKWGFYGLAVNQLLIFAVPFIYAWYIKADFKKLFSLHGVKIKYIIGAVSLWISAYLLAMIVGNLLMPIFPESVSNLTDMNQMLMETKTPLLVFVVAMMPPIAEECLFRGFLMGTLKEKCKPAIAIGVTTFIFAAYHMSILKMFTVGIIGFALTYAAYKSNCIFISSLMHFLNNLFAVLISKYPEEVAKCIPIATKETVEGTDIVILAVVIIVTGFFGFFLLRNKEKTSEKVLAE